MILFMNLYKYMLSRKIANVYKMPILGGKRYLRAYVGKLYNFT